MLKDAWRLRALPIAVSVGVFLWPGVASGQITNDTTFRLFERRCAVCHDNRALSAEERGPSRDTLARLTPERIYEALADGGVMAPNAEGLTDDELRGLATFVSGRPFGNIADRTADAMPNRCPSSMRLADPTTGPRWNGWSPDAGGNARFQPTAAAGLTAEQVPRLKLKWAFGFPDAVSAWAPPTIAGGWVFVGSDNGMVYALDAATACVHWSFEAETAIASGIILGATDHPEARYAAYFGDWKGTAYALDAETGSELWSTRIEDHPTGAKIRATPVLDEDSGRLYVPMSSWEEVAGPNLSYECCTFQGSITALDTSSGRQIWKTPMFLERPSPLRETSQGTLLYAPAGAAVWSTPTIDRERRALYFGTGNAYIHAPERDGGFTDALVALDLDTGEHRWHRQLLADDSSPGGCGRTPEERERECPGSVFGISDDVPSSPILHTLPDGQRVVIVQQESRRTTAFDPDRGGALVWQKMPEDWPGTGARRVAVNIGGFGNVDDGSLYYVPLGYRDKTGGVIALDPATGEQVWYTDVPKRENCPDPEYGGRCDGGLHAAATGIPGAIFAGGRDGMLYAFADDDGRILWSYDTHREFETVNGVEGYGGGIGSAGPVVVDGLLLIGSGYTVTNALAGNVLLAFTAE